MLTYKYNYAGVVLLLIFLCPYQAFSDDWKFTAAPYTWLTGVNGDVNARRRSASFDQSFGDILDDLDFAVMGRFEGVKDNFILTGDIEYIDLSDTKDVRSSDIKGDLDETILELGGGYRILDLPAESSYPRLSIDVLAGTRYMDLDLQLHGPFGKDPSTNLSYWEPFLGPRIKLAFNEIWSIGSRADFGGFGIGNDPNFTWQMTSGVAYQASKIVAIELGYKLLDINGLKNDNTNLDVRMSGLILGIRFAL